MSKTTKTATARSCTGLTNDAGRQTFTVGQSVRWSGFAPVDVGGNWYREQLEGTIVEIYAAQETGDARPATYARIMTTKHGERIVHPVVLTPVRA
jgi:hypothetical protein